MDTFSDLHTRALALVLSTLSRLVRDLPSESTLAPIQVLLALALGRVTDQAMTLCRWRITAEAIAAANGGQNKMPVITDYVEANTFGDRGGDWMGQAEWVARVVEHVVSMTVQEGTVRQSLAQKAWLPDDFIDAMITDPPYYDAFPYSDLSDFFFVWIRRALPKGVLSTDQSLVQKMTRSFSTIPSTATMGERRTGNFLRKK